jgi:hypothetical protein
MYVGVRSHLIEHIDMVRRVCAGRYHHRRVHDILPHQEGYRIQSHKRFDIETHSADNRDGDVYGYAVPR